MILIFFLMFPSIEWEHLGVFFNEKIANFDEKYKTM